MSPAPSDLATRNPRSSEAAERRFSVGELMVLVAGVSVGLWLFLPKSDDADPGSVVMGTIFGVLGGLSLVGVPLLLLERFRERGTRVGPPWEAGKLTWFASGMSAWLLWPPIAFSRLQGESFDRSATGICFFYGTPLMAVYMTLALLTGGWLRRRRRRRRARSWRERFGLVLSMAWACTGLYLLATLYLSLWKH